MNITLLGWVATWLILIATHSLASGSVISTIPSDKVQVTHQRALIHYTNGTETLVIETEFKGEGTNFAWIVAVPSIPEIEPATRGLFPTLQLLFRPRAVANVEPLYSFIIWLGIFVGSIIFTIRCCKGLIVAVLLCWVLIAYIAYMCRLFVDGYRDFLPRDAISLLERNPTTAYDMRTLVFNQESALMNWLNENGFATSTNLTARIHAAAAEGCAFVASKIHLNTPPNETVKPDPLILRFQTPKPVFPMRLNDSGNDTSKVELYVFGAARAQIPGFAVERCAKTSPTHNSYMYKNSDLIALRHPLLRKLVEGSPVATKLTAQLNSNQTKQDAYITWKSYWPKRLSIYSKQGAAVTAKNYATPFAVLAALVMISTVLNRRVWVRKVRLVCMAVIGLSVILSFVIYFSLPTGQVIPLRAPPGQIALELKISDVLNSRWHQNPDAATNSFPEIAWIRQQFADPTFWEQADSGSYFRGNNVLTEQLCREEDSPGNYTLRQEGAEVNHVVYDIDGGTLELPLMAF